MCIGVRISDSPGTGITDVNFLVGTGSQTWLLTSEPLYFVIWGLLLTCELMDMAGPAASEPWTPIPTFPLLVL